MPQSSQLVFALTPGIVTTTRNHCPKSEMPGSAGHFGTANLPEESGGDGFCHVLIFLDLIEVHVAVDL
ncbi:hypothetical protein P1940_20305, partial [Xanthomonas perforans]